MVENFTKRFYLTKYTKAYVKLWLSHQWPIGPVPFKWILPQSCRADRRQRKPQKRPKLIWNQFKTERDYCYMLLMSPSLLLSFLFTQFLSISINVIQGFVDKFGVYLRSRLSHSNLDINDQLFSRYISNFLPILQLKSSSKKFYTHIDMFFKIETAMLFAVIQSKAFANILEQIKFFSLRGW